MDLLFEGQTEVPGIPDMYRMKTGALFRCSAMAGAILAGASTNVVELCGTWGELFGYAYQIIDDIEDSGAGGKEQDKNTLLKTMSVSEACTEAKQSLTKSIEAASAVFPAGPDKELSGIYLSGSRTLSILKVLNILILITASDDHLLLFHAFSGAPCHPCVAQKRSTSTPFGPEPLGRGRGTMIPMWEEDQCAYGLSL